MMTAKDGSLHWRIHQNVHR